MYVCTAAGLTAPCGGYGACRDIKLENTLLTASCPIPRVKLCDFGYSKNEFWDSPPRSVSGTPDYIAPEVLQNEHYDGKKADIWSAGTGALFCIARLSSWFFCLSC